MILQLKYIPITLSFSNCSQSLKKSLRGKFWARTSLSDQLLDNLALNTFLYLQGCHVRKKGKYMYDFLLNETTSLTLQ